MAKEKPLSEKQDYYSMRRKATQDVMEWINDGLSERKICLKLLMKYGFSKSFYFSVLDLLTDESEKE
jgi:hypothetical protein